MLGELYTLERGAELFCVTAGCSWRARRWFSPGSSRRSKRSPRRARERLPGVARRGAPARRRRRAHRDGSRATTARSGATRCSSRTTDGVSRPAAGSRACPSSSRGFRELRGLDGDRARARARRGARDGDEGGEHTTNMVAVDAHGRACVLTHSLGVGAGVWLPGFDVQLNNLLGESDIAFGEPAPGRPPAEPHGAVSRLRRRRARARDRVGGGDAPAHGARDRARRRSSTRGSTPRPLSPARASTPPRHWSTRSRAWTRPRSRS